MPPGALQVIPDAAHEVTHYLFKHPQVDFIWVTGGPKIVALANAAGKPGLSVGPGNAPIYVHRSADLTGAVVDILISKTFDASVICPAEQTCIVDAEVYDEMVAEFERMGAHLLTAEQVDALAEFAFGCGDTVNMAALGQQAPELAARAGFTVPPETKILLAPLPSDLEELADHPLVQEKLMPVLGLVRADSVEHAIDAAVLVTEHGGLGHTSADLRPRPGGGRRLRPGGAHRTDPGQRAHCRRCARRHLQQPDADLLARLRHLGRLEHDRERQLPAAAQHQDRLASGAPRRSGSGSRPRSSSTPVRSTTCATSTATWWSSLPTRRASRVGSSTTCARKLRTRHVHVFGEVEPEPDEAVIRPRRCAARADPSRRRCRRRRRLGARRGQGHAAVLRAPGAEPRRSDSAVPRPAEAGGRLPAATRTRSGWSRSPPRRAPAPRCHRPRCVTVGDRKETLVDYSLVPDIAIVDPVLTLSMPPSVTVDSGIDALTHALEAVGVDLRLAVHRRVLRPGGAAHLRRAAEGVRRTRPISRPHRHGQRGDSGRDWRSQTRSSAPTMPSRTRPAHGSALPTAGPMVSSCRMCCATTQACRASSCRRRDTPPTSRRTSTHSSARCCSVATSRRGEPPSAVPGGRRSARSAGDAALVAELGVPEDEFLEPLAASWR